MLIILNRIVTFYDEVLHHLNFLMDIFLKALPAIHLLLGFLLAAWTLTFLLRIVLTWYPKVDLEKGFWILIAWPTEPILILTRQIVPPIGGVDVSPVIWVGITSLFRELIVGQQGLLSQILISSQNLK